MTTTTALAINIPLMVLAFALMTAIPLWMVVKRPDRHPAQTRAVPQYRRVRAAGHVYPAAQSWNSRRLRLTTR